MGLPNKPIRHVVRACAQGYMAQSIDLSHITEMEMSNQIILLVARAASMDWLYPVRMGTTTGN